MPWSYCSRSWPSSAMIQLQNWRCERKLWRVGSKPVARARSIRRFCLTHSGDRAVEPSGSGWAPFQMRWTVRHAGAARRGITDSARNFRHNGRGSAWRSRRACNNWPHCPRTRNSVQAQGAPLLKVSLPQLAASSTSQPRSLAFSWIAWCAQHRPTDGVAQSMARMSSVWRCLKSIPSLENCAIRILGLAVAKRSTAANSEKYRPGC